MTDLPSRKDKCDYSAAVMLMKGDKVMMVLRDNAPIWQIAGSAALNDEEKASGDPATFNFRAAAMRGAEFKTGIPASAYEQTLKHAVTFMLVTKVDGEDVIMEESHMFIADIGDAEPFNGDNMPVGAQHDFFPLDNIPKNAYDFQQPVFNHVSVNGPQDENAAPVLVRYDGETNVLQGLNAEDITGLDLWNSHPKVIAKRAAGQLASDPFPPRP